MFNLMLLVAINHFLNFVLYKHDGSLIIGFNRSMIGRWKGFRGCSEGWRIPMFYPSRLDVTKCCLLGSYFYDIQWDLATAYVMCTIYLGTTMSGSELQAVV